MSEQLRTIKEQTAEAISPEEVAEASELVAKALKIEKDDEPGEVVAKVTKTLAEPSFLQKITQKGRMALAILIASGVLANALPSFAQAEGPLKPTQIAQMKAQERIGLQRAIKVAEQAKVITGEEGNGLLNLIELGKGYPEMLQDFVNKYKKQNKSMDDFFSDVYAGKIGPKQEG